MSWVNPILDRLEQGVLYETQKAAVIAHNVANIDTPDFQRVSFSVALKKARRQLGLDESSEDDYGTGEVILEKEMSTLGKTKLRHSSYLRLLGLHYGILKRVATQGKG